jgi:hypothetical protein
MADLSVTVEEPPEEVLDPVRCWRLEVLLDAGYDAGLALQIAVSTADLHLATQLLEQGCPADVAGRILL